jgi:steroid delta-isomerase-like uncharacterized protein
MADYEALARGWFELVHARDWEAVAALYGADSVYRRSDGTSRGRDAHVAYLQSVVDAFPDHASTVDGVLVAGSAVTLEWTETGTHTEPYNTARFGTIPPTGQGFKAHVVEVFRFEGEEIASQNEYYDLMTIAARLGWLAAMAGGRPAEATTSP